MTVIGKETKVGQEAEIYQMVNGVQTKVLGFDPTTGLAKDVSGKTLGRAQDMRDGQARTGAYIFTSLSLNGVSCGDSDQFSFTDGSGNDKPFTFLFTGKFTSLATGQAILSKFDNSSNASREYYFGLSNSALIVQLVTSGGSPTYLVNRSSVLSKSGWGTAAVTYDGSKTNAGLKLYLDGTQLSTTSENVGVYAGMNNCAAPVLVGSLYGSYGAPWLGEFNRAIVFNYALSADKVARYSSGAKLDFEDIGGSMVPVVSDNFSTDTYWTKDTGCVIGSNVCTFTNVNINEGLTKAAILTIGKLYRLTFKISSYTDGSVGLLNNSGYYRVTRRTKNGVDQPLLLITDGTYAPNDVWVFEFVVLNDTTMRIRAGTAGTDLVIDDVSLIQLGAVLDYEPESATPSVWHDESGNQLDGTVTGATLVDTPHFIMTDYGVGAVVQDVQDSAFHRNKYSLGLSDYVDHAALEPSLAIGASDATMLVTARMPAGRSGQLLMLQNATHYLQLRTHTNGQLAMGDADGTSSTALLGIYAPPYGGAATYVGVRYNTDKYRGYINGVAGPEVTKTRKAPVGNLPCKIGNSTSDSINGEVSRALCFNYALSEDKIRRYSAGASLDYEDVGGSMTPLTFSGSFVNNGSSFESGFSGTANSWTGVNSASTAWTVNGGLVLVAGKLYTVTVTLTLQAGQTVEVYLTNGSWVDSSDHVTLTASGTYSFNLKCTTDQSNGYLNFFVVGTHASAASGTNISIRRAGAIVALEPENISDSVWVDASGNNIHCLAQGSTCLAQKFAPVYDVKNYLINGNFEFIQRGAYNTEVTGQGFMLLDRWYVTGINAGVGPSTVGVSQVGSVPSLEGSGYHIRMRVTDTTTDAIQLYQRIEGSNAGRLCNKFVTLTFWVCLGSTSPVSGLTKGYKISALTYYPTVSDNYGATTNGPSTVIYPTLSTTYQRISIPIGFIGAAAYTGLQVTLEFSTIDRTGENFTQNGWFQVSHMMLTEGNVPPPPTFLRAGGSYGGELALCQRYYEKSYSTTIAPGTNTTGGMAELVGSSNGTNTVYMTIPFKVTKRITPPTSYKFYAAGGTADVWNYARNGASGTVAPSGMTWSESSFYVGVNVGAAWVAADIGGHWVVDAEI